MDKHSTYITYLVCILQVLASVRARSVIDKRWVRLYKACFVRAEYLTPKSIIRILYEHAYIYTYIDRKDVSCTWFLS